MAALLPNLHGIAFKNEAEDEALKALGTLSQRVCDAGLMPLRPTTHLDCSLVTLSHLTIPRLDFFGHPLSLLRG